MSITATIEAGRIILPPGTPWPSGTVVRVEPVEPQPTLWDTLKDFDGIAQDLPTDLAANVDQHADKEWTLTDCVSFVTMRDLGLGEALTQDRHFEQAGFSVLLKP